MNGTRRIALTLIAAIALGAGFAVGAAQAAPANGGSVAPPEASTFDNVIDAAEMDDLVAITERIDQHLTVGEDGLVRLDADVSAADLGVSEAFLANYRDALAESNKLIERGEIVVDADMRVTPTEKLIGEFKKAGPGAGGRAGDAEEAVDAAPGEPVPDWCAWNYNTGAMYYNSYNTYRTYRNNYYGLCNSMAAYTGCSRCAPSLQYFYSYNNSYLNNYCYQNYGVYYYLPYQNSCGSYNPCYGNLGYKPMYYWGQTRTYNYNCRCNTYNWQWNGYWGRY